MRNITTIEELREAIQLLENQQANDVTQLKEEMNEAYERLHPINLINSILKDAFGSAELKDNLLNISSVFASGLVSKFLLRGIKNSGVKKILSTGLMLGVTSILSKHPNTVRNFTNRILGKKSDDLNTNQSHNGTQESVTSPDSTDD